MGEIDVPIDVAIHITLLLDQLPKPHLSRLRQVLILVSLLPILRPPALLQQLDPIQEWQDDTLLSDGEIAMLFAAT